MRFLHSIFTIIMALLVAMPMCVCGHTLLPEEKNQEHSCCPHHEEEKDPTDLGHDCELSNHDQLSFILEDEEELIFQIIEIEPAPFSFKELELFLITRNNFFSAPPPDCFSHSSRNITYCNYRL